MFASFFGWWLGVLVLEIAAVGFFPEYPWWFNRSLSKKRRWSMNGRIPKWNPKEQHQKRGVNPFWVLLSIQIHVSMFQRSIFEGILSLSGDRFPTTCRYFAHVSIQFCLFSFLSVLLVSCRCNKDEFKFYNRRTNSMVSQLQNSMGFFRIPEKNNMWFCLSHIEVTWSPSPLPQGCWAVFEKRCWFDMFIDHFLLLMGI